LVKKTRIPLSVIAVLAAVLVTAGNGICVAEELYAPDYLWKRNIASKTAPVEVADTHLGIPYRDDGAIDDRGAFTTFNRPDVLFDTPGLNCSGLVLSVSRFVLNRNISLAEASKDRRGDSGAGAPLGKDWDFGVDLLLNITEALPRRIISPDGQPVDLNTADFSQVRGFDLHNSGAWRAVLAQMKTGCAYFGSISKTTKKSGYDVLHYHVVLMVPDDKGAVWLYHATRRSGCHKINMKTPDGMRKFMAQFRDAPGDGKKMLVIEAALPGYEKPPETAVAAEEPGEKPSSSTGAAAIDPKTASKQALEILKEVHTSPEPAPGTTQTAARAAEAPSPAASTAPQGAETAPPLVVNHLSGRVYRLIPGLVVHAPKLADNPSDGALLSFVNSGNTARDIEVLMRGPQGDSTLRTRLKPGAKDVKAVFPKDFGRVGPVLPGKYVMEVSVDGAKWTSDSFEIASPKDAKPKITAVNIPAVVKAGTPFTVTVTAQNEGVESDYGGITVSTPDPGALRLVSAQPGKIFGVGSVVLSVTSDKIRLKAPMAERWIELWGENKVYDMKVTLKADRPGTYPLYVRCALRSAGTKSSVVLMDPQASGAVDQQGFPVHVHTVVVR
jgi:hypothetical protein